MAMNINVNLTGDLFNDFHTIDFYDSKTIFFDATTFLPKTVSFDVWGPTLCQDLIGGLTWI